jgi:N-acyl homoserine lactone hydrolase
LSTDIRLYPFQCGSTTIPLRNHILGAGLAGEMITTPVIWFLLTHPRGNVIIDGGNPAEVAIPELEH